ncbi:MAG: hypothetical protein QXM27_03040 [Candidatus Pacearchaeota archaeon]
MKKIKLHVNHRINPSDYIFINPVLPWQIVDVKEKYEKSCRVIIFKR